MNCPTRAEWHLLAVEALSDADAAPLRAHAEACAACQAELIAARRAHIDRLRMYEAFDADHDRLRDGLLATVAREQPAARGHTPTLRSRLKGSFMRNTRYVRWGALLAPAACIAIIVSIFLLPGGQHVALADVVERLRSVKAATWKDWSEGGGVVRQPGAFARTYVSDFGAMRSSGAFIDQWCLPDGSSILLRRGQTEAIRTEPTSSGQGWPGAEHFISVIETEISRSKYVGTETVDGVVTDVFEQVRPGGKYYHKGTLGKGSDSHYRFYINRATKLPVRVERRSIINDQLSPTAHVQGDFQWDSEVDASVFEPPMNTITRIHEVRKIGLKIEAVTALLGIYADTFQRYPKALDTTVINGELNEALQKSNRTVAEEAADMQVHTIWLDAHTYLRQFEILGISVQYDPTVTPGDANGVLARWTDKKGQTHTIHGDLSVKDE